MTMTSIRHVGGIDANSPFARLGFLRGALVLLMGILGLAATSPTAGAAATGVDLNQNGISGAWYDPATSGQGFVISVMPNADGAGHASYFGGWFTFADRWSGEYYRQPLGTPMWLTLQGSTANPDPDYGMALEIFDNDGRLGLFNEPPAVAANLLGRAYISLSDCNHLNLHYTVQYRADSVDPQWFDRVLVRLMPNVNCSETIPAPAARANYFGFSGAWYDPDTNGQGFAFEANPVNGQFFGGWFTYARSSLPTADKGRRWYTLQGPFDVRAPDLTMAYPLVGADVGIYATSGGSFDTANGPSTVITTTQVGIAEVYFFSCQTARVSYQFYGGENAGLSGAILLVRMGPVPDNCKYPLIG